ncbi:hypothetical protein ACVIW0_005610 [Bradyrhizobium sp. USDA 4454]
MHSPQHSSGRRMALTREDTGVQRDVPEEVTFAYTHAADFGQSTYKRCASGSRGDDSDGDCCSCHPSFSVRAHWSATVRDNEETFNGCGKRRRSATAISIHPITCRSSPGKFGRVWRNCTIKRELLQDEFQALQGRRPQLPRFCRDGDGANKSKWLTPNAFAISYRVTTVGLRRPDSSPLRYCWLKPDISLNCS